LTVSDLSRMLVRADVDEADVVDISLGQKAKIKVDALPDTAFAGTVLEIGNTAKRSLTSTVEGQTNFEVKAGFADQVPQLRAGATAACAVAPGRRANRRAGPSPAVVVRTGRELERAAKAGARAARRPKPGDALAAEDDTVGRKQKEITGVFVVQDNKAKFVPV